jgi:glycosyltransferase involved in cell wall biosynthesis
MISGIEGNQMSACSVAVVIITFNEEVNLPQALQSAVGWAEQVFVVDSFSTDRTLEVAQAFGVETCQHPFDSFGTQKNWALENLPITADWVLFLDADEYLSEEIKTEIPPALRTAPADVNGFVTDIKYIYLGRWIKHGDIYRKLVRMIRRDHASYIVTSAYHEKMVVQGQVGRLKGRIVHDDHKTLREWVDKQMTRIEIDAQGRMRRHQTSGESPARGSEGVTIEGGRSIWLKKRLNSLPGPVRPFAQFFYRYILRLGFLDGWPGFVYNFLFQFWYPLMVEALYLEAKLRTRHSPARPAPRPSASDVVSVK